MKQKVQRLLCHHNYIIMCKCFLNNICKSGDDMQKLMLASRKVCKSSHYQTMISRDASCMHALSHTCGSDTSNRDHPIFNYYTRLLQT